MKNHSITAALLSTVLIAGCSDRNAQNAANPGQPGAATTQDLNQSDDTSIQARREAVSPDADSPAVRPDTRGSRATAGSRVEPAPRESGESARNNDRFNAAPPEGRTV